MQSWHDFFIAEVGASAALAGLLFVALSINMEHILSDAALPARAAQSLAAFMLVVVLGSLALIPDQTLNRYGFESLAAIFAALAIAVRMSDVQLREVNDYRRHMIVNVAVNGSLHALALGGAVSLDRAGRTEGVDWWPQEEITPRQAASVIEAGPAAVMVTHECPAGI